MSTEKHTCEQRIYCKGGWDPRGHLCAKGATLSDKGQWYCKTHHPPTKQAKFDAEYQAYNAVCKEREAKRQQLLADHERMEALATISWPNAIGQVLDKYSDYDDLRAAIDEWVKDRNMRP